jgi:hypothetical protein
VQCAGRRGSLKTGRSNWSSDRDSDLRYGLHGFPRGSFYSSLARGDINDHGGRLCPRVAHDGTGLM